MQVTAQKELDGNVEAVGPTQATPRPRVFSIQTVCKDFSEFARLGGTYFLASNPEEPVALVEIQFFVRGQRTIVPGQHEARQVGALPDVLETVVVEVLDDAGIVGLRVTRVVQSLQEDVLVSPSTGKRNQKRFRILHPTELQAYTCVNLQILLTQELTGDWSLPKSPVCSQTLDSSIQGKFQPLGPHSSQCQKIPPASQWIPGCQIACLSSPDAALVSIASVPPL